MKVLLKVGIIMASPYLFFVYWRNSVKEIDNLHTRAELNWTAEN